MSDADFNQFKKTVKNEAFESSELAIVKQVIPNNYFTMKQIKEITEIFYSDAPRLDVLKTAYKNTIDKTNYYTLIDILTFSDAKDDFMKFLKTQ